MATSGSTNFTQTRDSIIKASARLCSAISSGETPSTALIDDFAEALNRMVKHWQGSGIHVWTVTEGVLFPQVGQVKYELGTSSTDHATNASDLAQTTLSSDAADGATSLTVTSITGISNGDYIGIVVDDGTVHWTTVNGSPSGSTVTITTGLDDSAASGQAVFAYTSKIPRPLRIPSARWYDISSSIESPDLLRTSRLDYQSLPVKTNSGSVNQFFYDPQLNLGNMYLWQVPSAIDGYVKFTYYRPIEDFDAAGDNPDLPQEWLDCLVWNLAARMAVEFDIPDSKYVRIETKAAQFLDEMKDWDREMEPVYFGYDFT